MPLSVNGVQMEASLFYSVEDLFLVSPKLKSDSEDFLAHSHHRRKVLKDSERVLYVSQHEYANISGQWNPQSFSYIASADATTCIIVVFIHPSLKLISLAHLDGVDTKNGVRKILYDIQDASIKCSCENSLIDLYVFGGFSDTKKISECLFKDIVQVCAQEVVNVDLKLAVTCSLNTICRKQHNCPIIYGIGVEISTQNIYAIECDNRGPDHVLRETRLLFSNKRGLNRVYGYNKDSFSIEPFVFHIDKPIEKLLTLHDELYLELMSTSPHCEPKHFVACSKKTVVFALQNQNRDFFLGKNREYILNGNNKWEILDPMQTLIENL